MAKTKADDRPVLNVKIFSPFKTFFDGKAYSISAENKTGAFDILQGHTNFLTLLVPSICVVETKTGPLKFQIDGGVLHVTKDSVVLFLNV